MQGLFLVKRLLLITVSAALPAYSQVAPLPRRFRHQPPGLPGRDYPDPLPRANVCRKAMEGDFYMVMGQKVDVIVDWYVKHLVGFKKYHALTDHRSQDTFFNSDGTQEVTGSPNSTEVFSISYGRFEPGAFRGAGRRCLSSTGYTRSVRDSLYLDCRKTSISNRNLCTRSR